MSGDIYLTQEGYEKLVNDLEHLKTVKRRALAKAIGEARAHGDISENAEYDAAKEAQGMNEKKIFEFLDSREAGNFIKTFVQKNDIVLVKGSQGMRMERVVEMT